jgi:hypothetical protein
MCEHHRVQQADPSRQPGGKEVGTRIEHVSRREQQSEAVLANPKPVEEPVSEQSIRKEATTQAVNAGEGRELHNDGPRLRRESCSWVCSGALSTNFNFG